MSLLKWVVIIHLIGPGGEVRVPLGHPVPMKECKVLRDIARSNGLTAYCVHHAKEPEHDRRKHRN